MRSEPPFDGAVSQALVRAEGLASGAERVGDGAPAAARQARAWRSPLTAARSVAYSGAGLFTFVLALQMLKTGAGGLKPVLDAVSASGTANFFGFGWLASYAVMSGGPVAAVSLSLFAGGAISDTEAFAMLNGSRLGASFIVLFVGFILYLTHRRTADGLFIGVVALLTAATLWLPVLPIGLLALKSGWFDSIRVGTPGGISSVIETVYDPIVNRLNERLPQILVMGLGVGTIMAAFAMFDRALPNLESASGTRTERVREWLHHPLAMFALGLAVTSVTMSVSISITLLIPLSLKGYLRRDSVIPYVMGANIATWDKTLVAALLLQSPHAFTIVFTELAVGTAVSLFVLIFLYKPYSRAILALSRRITYSRRAFAAFMAAMLLVPAVLMLV